MKPLHRVKGLALGALMLALVAAVATAPAAAGAGSTGAACTAARTQIWLGNGQGGGFAGGYGLPLEFSNVGRTTCTLYGYPGVSAYSGALRQLGPAASRIPERRVLVRLRPGATAHAFLRVADAGAVCGRNHPSADGLRVYAPGQRHSRTISVRLAVCRRSAVLAVGVVRPGVGIPGYVTQ